MGAEYLYKCDKCSYQVKTSGRPDRGFFSFTDTYICYSCQKIFDITEKVIVGTESKTVPEPKKKFLGIPIPSKDKLVYENKFEEFEILCPKCGSKTGLVKWDNVNKPCPRCDGRMEKNMGWVLMWD